MCYHGYQVIYIQYVQYIVLYIASTDNYKIASWTVNHQQNVNCSIELHQISWRQSHSVSLSLYFISWQALVESSHCFQNRVCPLVSINVAINFMAICTWDFLISCVRVELFIWCWCSRKSQEVTKNSIFIIWASLMSTACLMGMHPLAIRIPQKARLI